MHPNLAAPLRAVADRIRPRPAILPSVWSNTYRHLSSLASPEPGKWDTDRAPYVREIMDCFALDSPVEWVIFRSGTQVGKSEVANNVIGYYMHWAPRPIVMVQPNEQGVSDYSEQRIDDLIKSSPVLRALVGDQHTKDAQGRKGKDSIATKKFPGGVLFILAATSGPALRSKPAGVILVDELNGAPRLIHGEGSPVAIVEHRSQNFLDRKIMLTSTPTDEGDSPICDWYELGTKELFEVPCLRCGTMQPLFFRKLTDMPGGIVWPSGRPDQACYECAHCSHAIDHCHKTEMLRAGRWHATTDKPTLPRARSFHLNALYSPWVRWSKLAEKFVIAKEDPVKMRDFVTLDLAEAWKHGAGEAFDEHELATRAEDGLGAGEPIEVPGWVQVLTSFADVQDDRLEVSVWGWNAAVRCCLIGHWIFWGDPMSKGDERTWGELGQLLQRQFRAPGGMLGIAAGGIDSGAGTHQASVYAFVRSGGWQKRRQFATKGLSSRTGIQDSRPIWPQKVAKKKGVATSVPMNVGLAKYHLHLRLAKPGMVVFPKRTTPSLPVDYYAQLCAEELVRKSDAAGHRTWQLKKGVDRNEALDCAVGSYAAFLGIRHALPLPCGERSDLPRNATPARETTPEKRPAMDKPKPAAKPERRPEPVSDFWANRRKDSWRRLPS